MSLGDDERRVQPRGLSVGTIALRRTSASRNHGNLSGRRWSHGSLKLGSEASSRAKVFLKKLSCASCASPSSSEADTAGLRASEIPSIPLEPTTRRSPWTLSLLIPQFSISKKRSCGPVRWI